MSIRFKVLGVVAAVVLLNFVVVLFTVYNIHKMNATASRVMTIQQKVVRNIEAADRLVQRATKTAMYSLMTGNMARMQEAEGFVEEARSRLLELSRYLPQTNVKQRILAARRYLEGYNKNLDTAFKRFGALTLSAEQKGLVEGIIGAEGKVASELRALRDYLTKDLDARLKEQLAQGGRVSKITVILMILDLLVGLVIAFILADRMARTSAKLANGLKELAQGEGDLRFRFKEAGDDELGQAVGWFNRFMDTLVGMVKGIKEAVSVVEESVARVSSASQELSATLEETSQTTASIAAAAEELEKTAEELENNAKVVADNAEKNERSAVNGFEHVSRLSENILRIKEEFDVMASQIRNLHNYAQSIKEIVSVINDIADQTNLLALNAAIEAARAGEHGRGFAVVADEIRKLAEKTTAQTRNIEELIRNITDQVETYVATVERNTDDVVRLSEYAKETMEILEKVREQSTEAKNQVQAMYQALQEQKIATTQVSQGLAEINIAVEESSKALVDITNSMKDVVDKVDNLKRLTDGFRV